MKIAIVSDIHGNLTALESVLPGIKKEADRVICLGDVAATGPQPRETIAFLRRAKWPCVLGNTDERLAMSEAEDFGHSGMPKEEREMLRSLDDWTGSQVDSSDRRFLARFRPTIELRDRNHSILCYHGSPRSNVEQILSTTPEEKLSEAFTGQSAQIYAGGHTHAQMVRKFGSSMVINPGSIGLPFLMDREGRAWNPTWAEYAMVTSTGSELRVDLRRANYRLRDLKASVLGSGMPNQSWWIRDWFQPAANRRPGIST